MSGQFDPYAPDSTDRYEAMAKARTGDGVVSTPVGYCLATVVLETLCDRVARFQLVDGFVPVPNPVFGALGPRALPVTLTPVAA